MDPSRGLRLLGSCKALAGIVFASAFTLVGSYATQARADMCLNSHHDLPPSLPDAGDDGADGAVSMNHKRNVGAGLLASASVATVWLSLRRSNAKKRG